VLLAKTPDAQRELNALFAAHAIERRYLAVVASSRRIEQKPRQGEMFRIEVPLDGRSAVSEVEVALWSARAAEGAGAAAGPLFAVVLVRLETGRPRQIRRHLALEGMPVVGETEDGRRSGGRLLLHAYALALPWRGETIRATSPIPAAFLRDASALGLDLTTIPAVASGPSETV
jgi:23S rRNA-/tRNA-specific pseudouridylate synthase